MGKLYNGFSSIIAVSHYCCHHCISQANEFRAEKLARLFRLTTNEIKFWFLHENGSAGHRSKW